MEGMSEDEGGGESLRCAAGLFVGYEDWKCSDSRRKIGDFERRDQSYRRKGFEETLNIELKDTDSVCNKCVDTFSRRRVSSCKYEKHTSGNRTKSQRDIRYITVPEYFKTFKTTNLFPNDGICSNCFTSVQEKEEEPYDEPVPTKRAKLDELNKIRKSLIPDSEPLSFDKKTRTAQGATVLRGAAEIKDTIIRKFEEEGLPITETEDLEKLRTDSKDLRDLMLAVKEKMQGCTIAEKKSLVTLAPNSWTIEETVNFFGVSKHLVKKSNHLKKMKGLLPTVDPKKGKKLDEGVKEKVVDFFNRDDISRSTPGLKSVKSVKNPETGKREKRQKRYLLANLKELHQTFLQENVGTKIGITSFVLLKPTECSSLHTTGFHNVCLCIHHENVQLLFNAIKITDKKQYIPKAVCDQDSKDCYYRRCPNCAPNLTSYKAELLATNKVLLENEDITYRRWLSTDGTEFVVCKKNKEEFADFLIAELEKLLKHHYISRSQSRYFRNLRDNLPPDEIIIQGDFAENFTPSIQDAVQSEYFSRSHKQITIHPFHIIWRQSEVLYTKGLCVISESNQHDSTTVFVYLSKLIPLLMKDFARANITVNKIHYFSDGCAAQYKNRKHFTTLYYHEKDFGVKAAWNFTATAHGKSSCDAYGGTTKRLAHTAALTGEKLTTAKELYDWCSKKIKNLEYMFVTEEEIETVVEKYDLASRFEELQTVTGTQKFHRVQVEDDKLLFYETSEDTTPETTRVMKSGFKGVTMDDIEAQDWIGCVYDGKWYIAQIESVDLEDQEVFVRFWKDNNAGIGTSFVRDNSSCYVPVGQILKKITPPKAATRRQRTINIPLEVQEELSKLLSLM